MKNFDRRIFIKKSTALAALSVAGTGGDYTGYVFNVGYARAMMQAVYSTM